MNAADLLKFLSALAEDVDLNQYDVRIQTCGNRYYRIESASTPDELPPRKEVILYVA